MRRRFFFRPRRLYRRPFGRPFYPRWRRRWLLPWRGWGCLVGLLPFLLLVFVALVTILS